MASIQELSISDLEMQDPRAPIYALNNSTRSDVGEPGDLLIGIPKLNGSKADLLRIDQTWLPIELTGQIPRSQLLESSEFRRAVSERLIILVSAETAQKLNSQEGASLERKKLATIRKQIKAGGAARTIADANVTIRRESGEEDTPEEQVEITSASQIEGVELTEEGLEPKFKMWANRLEMRADLDCKSEIRAHGSLKKREVKYLIKILANKPKTVAWLKSKITKKA